MTARIEPGEKLRRRVAEVTDSLEAYGWKVTSARLEGVPDCWPAVGIAAVQAHATPSDDEVVVALTMALAVRTATNRILTLVDEDRGDAKVTVELDDGRYWFSRHASAWEAVAPNGLQWCGLEPTDELARAVRIAARLRSSVGR